MDGVGADELRGSLRIGLGWISLSSVSRGVLVVGVMSSFDAVVDIHNRQVKRANR